MTDQEIKKLITKTAILNDLLELNLNTLITQPINHKNLEKTVIRSKKSSNSLTKVMDSKLGKRAAIFGELYDQIGEILDEIIENILS